MKKTISYVVVFKDERIHVYSSKNDKEFLKTIEDFGEVEVVFKVKGESAYVTNKSEEIINASKSFIEGVIEKDVLTNVFDEFLFERPQKRSFSFFNILRKGNK